MFGLLKNKIKEAVAKITKKVEETPESTEVKEKPLETKKEIKEQKKPELKEIKKEEVKEDPKKEKKSISSLIKEKITTRKISDSEFEDIFWDLEVALLENNVALEVVEKIKENLKKDLVDKPIERNKVGTIIQDSLKNTINELFIEPLDLIKETKSKKPFVIVFVGINGSGKTTSIAKVAKKLLENNLSCVLVAADTWRAAAIQQLEQHGNNLGVKVIKHDYGADPAAVAFDGVKHAESKNIDVVLIDTAGRMHSNTNLQEEMKKIIRVAKPDMKIFVGESITGNDCVEQAEIFNGSIGIDGIILTKFDVDEKGGAPLSISYVTKKPILFVGTGQEYSDLKKFDKEVIIKNLGI